MARNNDNGYMIDDMLEQPWGADMPHMTPDPWDQQGSSQQPPGQPPAPPPPPGQPPQTSQQPTGPSYQPTLEGFESSKLNDPNHAATSPKYAFGQLANSGNYGYDEGARLLADLQAQYPDLFGGWTYANDKFRYTGDPNQLHSSWEGVDELDFVRNFSQGGEFDPSQAAFWWGASSPQSRAAQQAGGGPGGAGGPSYPVPGMFPPGGGGFGGGSGSGGGTTTFTSQTGIAPPPGVSDKLWAMLMERAEQGTNIDSSDPNVRRQADAYSAQAERARRNYLGDMAESSSPYATGAMLGQHRMTADKLGQDVGGFEAQLIGREIQTRRDEIRHALDSMGQLLTEQQRMQLQKELATMDDSLERLRIGTQNSQFYSGLGQADRHFNMDDAFRYWAGNNANNQFYDNLGFQMDNQDQYWDWQYRNM